MKIEEVQLHSPSIDEAAASGAGNEKLEAFVDRLMTMWDAKKARRCRSLFYNDDVNKPKVMSTRAKKSRQQKLENSSFALLQLAELEGGGR